MIPSWKRDSVNSFPKVKRYDPSLDYTTSQPGRPQREPFEAHISSNSHVKGRNSSPLQTTGYPAKDMVLRLRRSPPLGFPLIAAVQCLKYCITFYVENLIVFRGRKLQFYGSRARRTERTCQLTVSSIGILVPHFIHILAVPIFLYSIRH
jgi:hypothetical protein